MAADNTRNVYACIAAVSAELAQTGISKDRNNVQQGYKFRGIDDVYNAMAPLLAKHGLVIIPRILTRQVTERPAKSGGLLFYVTVEAEFDFVSSHDGSKTTARSFGEAMDSGDKATNKAMSAAYKYTAFQTFCIPTEGDNDADATTHEVAAPSTTRPRTAAAAAPKAPAPAQTPAPAPPARPTTSAPPAAAASRPSPPAQRSAQSGNGADLVISEAQAKRFHAIANGAGWRADELKNWLSEVWHLESSRDIPRAKYDDICKQVEQGIGG
jgi:hypothetical protein